MTRAKLLVNLKTFQRKWRIDPVYVQRFLRKTWIRMCNTGGVPREIRREMRWNGRAAGAPSVPAELTVVLMNDSQIRRYNQEFRERNYPTDVLSFPVNEIHVEVSSGKKAEFFYLGDILISMERTAEQAREKNHSTLTELKILLLHGMLHLVGYDHEVDRGQMESLERNLRKAIF